MPSKSSVEVDAPALTANTTHANADNTWEYLVAAHATLNTITQHIYGDEPYETPPCGQGMHGTVVSCAEMSSALSSRLETLWNRL